MSPNGQILTYPPSTYAGHGMNQMAQHQQQQQYQPGAMWASGFPAGPIIEDLCAPPMGMVGPGSPPINSMPARMPMGSMHPSSMPQVQNVFGLRHPTYHNMVMPPQNAMQAQSMQSRMVGSYPPYGVTPQQQAQAQQQAHHHARQQQQAQQHQQRQQQQLQQLDPSTMMPRTGATRVDTTTGFPSDVASSDDAGLGQHMTSPGGNPQAGMPLTPDNGYNSFMSP
ncbi:hypothetical protein B0T24DRAFT_618481 [Lasiosphaeria ovina]|uniref:Uncharacterized protein n=1 Tax=Lasiosphaeria ovina TaxID=92902 RepID=A0AAE0KI99_9PEZI|nr:hypothetical protein B0T24DRAFT_618481 [Lasiosphaeria ovina]